MQPTKLADKVILVKLTMRRASLTKRDAYLSDKIQRQEGDTSLTVLTKLFKSKDNPIAQIMSKYTDVYAYHKKHTLPYVDAGPRILPNDLYFEYTQETKHRIAMMDNLKRNYMPHYDQLVLEDVAYRNSGHAAGRACVGDYPTASQFDQSMSIDIKFQPMPDSRHFLFDLSEDDLKSFQQSEHEAAEAMNMDTIARMLKPLSALTQRLQEYQGQKGERFHNSLVENVIEGCDIALKLAINPTQELIDEINILKATATGCLNTVEVIKGSANARHDAKAKLEAVAARMAAFNI
jgi:hypothetical protein